MADTGDLKSPDRKIVRVQVPLWLPNLMKGRYMTKEQISNFRKILLTIVGPYAHLMSDEEIMAFRDKMQKNIDSVSKEDAKKEDAKKEDKSLTYKPFANLNKLNKNT